MSSQPEKIADILSIMFRTYFLGSLYFYISYKRGLLQRAQWAIGRFWFRQRPVAIMTPSIVAPGPLFTKRTDVLPQDLVKARGREIRL